MSYATTELRSTHAHLPSLTPLRLLSGPGTAVLNTVALWTDLRGDRRVPGLLESALVTPPQPASTLSTPPSLPAELEGCLDSVTEEMAIITPVMPRRGACGEYGFGFFFLFFFFCFALTQFFFKKTCSLVGLSGIFGPTGADHPAPIAVASHGDCAQSAARCEYFFCFVICFAL
jgi:hypothetical protein